MRKPCIDVEVFNNINFTNSWLWRKYWYRSGRTGTISLSEVAMQHVTKLYMLCSSHMCRYNA